MKSAYGRLMVRINEGSLVLIAGRYKDASYEVLKSLLEIFRNKGKVILLLSDDRWVNRYGVDIEKYFTIWIDSFEEQYLVINSLQRFFTGPCCNIKCVVFDNVLYYFLTSPLAFHAGGASERLLAEQIAMLKNIALRHKLYVFLGGCFDKYRDKPVMWRLFQKYVDLVLKTEYSDENMRLSLLDVELKEMESFDILIERGGAEDYY